MTESLDHSNSDVGELLRFETLLADLSAKFINVPAEDIDRQIEEAQRRVCEAVGLDLSSLWQLQSDNPVVNTLTHLYRPLGGPPVPETMTGDYFPWYQRRALAGEVIAVSSLDDLPEEAARDREVLSYYGIKTDLTIPLSVGGGPVFGSVSFNDTRRERRWSEELIRRLQLVAQIFANALARKATERALRESEARLSLAADAAAVGLWSLNLATDSFWFTDKNRELFKFPSGEEFTFERFLSHVHPDDRVEDLPGSLRVADHGAPSRPRGGKKGAAPPGVLRHGLEDHKLITALRRCQRPDHRASRSSMVSRCRKPRAVRRRR